jgi:hypothetical protein
LAPGARQASARQGGQDDACDRGSWGSRHVVQRTGLPGPLEPAVYKLCVLLGNLVHTQARRPCDAALQNLCTVLDSLQHKSHLSQPTGHPLRRNNRHRTACYLNCSIRWPNGAIVGSAAEEPPGNCAALAPTHNAMLMQAKQVVEVTWEDQQNINSFGKLNTDFQTVKAKLENHKVRCHCW